jgi:hypothetical protein
MLAFMEELWAAVAFDSYQAAKQVLLINQENGERHRLQPELDAILKACREYKPLSQHRNSLQSHPWFRGRPAFIQGGFEKLISLGLLRTNRDFIRAVCRNRQEADVISRSRQPQAEPLQPADGGVKAGLRPSEIRTICWVTRNRPKTVAKSIKSYHRNTSAHGHRVRYLVCDDGKTERECDTTVKALMELTSEIGCEIHYIGIREKRKIADELVRSSGISAETIEFALFDPFGIGRSYGANRNTALIATAGELALYSDDDVFCRPGITAAVNEGPSAPRIASRYQPDYADHFHSLEAAKCFVEEIPSSESDFIAAHERVLGKSSAQILRGGDGAAGNVAPEGPDADVGLCSPRLIRTLTNGDNRCLLSVPGVYGDSGMHTNRHVFGYRGENRERFVATEELFQRSIQERHIIHAFSRPHISDTIYVAGIQFGLDNREILPPYFPVLRGEDTLFAATVHRCVRGGFVTHIPFQLFHAPDGSRGGYESPFFERDIPGTEALYSLIAAYGPRPVSWDTASNIVSLGNMLAQYGNDGRYGSSASAAKEFSRELHHAVMQRNANASRILNDELIRHRRNPRWWAEAAERYIEGLAGVGEEDFLPGADLEEGSLEETLAKLRGLTAAFGELCRAWPLLIRAAKGGDSVAAHTRIFGL